MYDSSPHCGFRSCLAAPVGTLRPGSGPCWAGGAEPRCPLRGGTGAGSRSGTPTPGLTLEQYCSKPSAQARRMQPVETRQGPGLEEPSRPSWEPCRGHQRRGEGVGSPAAGVAAARCSCWLYKVRQCSERPRFFTDRLRLSPRLAISSISTRPEQARSERKTKQEVPRYVSHLCPPRNLSVRHPTALKSHNKAAIKSILNTILISVFIFSLRNSKATERKYTAVD